MDKSSTPGHTMADWLELHEISGVQLQSFLAQRYPFMGRFPQVAATHAPDTRIDMSAQSAWELCGQALEARLPEELRSAVKETQAHCRLVLGDLPKGGPRALTLPDSGNGYPLITSPYEGRAKDVLTLVHELGHAVQMVISNGSFMPPILRETCAFVAEEALLAHLMNRNDPMMAPVKSAWERETSRIMRAPFAALTEALEHPAAPYQYVWNYPPARAIEVGSGAIGRLFCGQDSLPDLLGQSVQNANNPV